MWTPVEASVLLFSFFLSSAAGTFPWGLRLLRLCLTSDCYHILTRSDPVNLTVRSKKGFNYSRACPPFSPSLLILETKNSNQMSVIAPRVNNEI